MNNPNQEKRLDPSKPKESKEGFTYIPGKIIPCVKKMEYFKHLGCRELWHKG